VINSDEEDNMATSKKRPRMFIGSSTEQLKLAYAVQENFDHEFEVTVWNQGIFKLSRTAMDSLLAEVGAFEVAVFIFTPDDVTQMRASVEATVRDNVIFELGLFAGSLGRDRVFLVVPRGLSVHLPTDLIGLTPASYDPDRTDKNWNAALGPACNQIRTSLASATEQKTRKKPPLKSTLTDPELIAILQSWIGGRDSRLNRGPIYFSEVDDELSLPDGTAKRFLSTAASKYYDVETEGPQLILLKPKPIKVARLRSPFT